MIRKKINSDKEVTLLIYMITSDRFLMEIAPIFNPKLLKTSYSKTIANWCIEYYSEFKCAPKQNIQDLYKNKIMIYKGNEEEKDAISLFLTNLSKKYEQLSEINNVDFSINEAVQYLKIRSGELLKTQIELALAENNAEKLETAITNYKRVEKPTGQGVDLLKDTNKIIQAFTMENDILITFPGDLGKVIQPINRGDFVSYFGPAKRGKSFWLWYTSTQALAHGCKVLHITLEMTENEMIRRAWPSLTGHPQYTKEIRYATFEQDDEGKFEVIQHEKEIAGMDLENVEQFQKKIKRLFRKGEIKILRPLDVINVSWIENILDNLYYYENFVPDAIVVDYADYMIPDKSFRGIDGREKINNIWVGLRQLAIRKNVAIITASHTAKITFDTDVKTSHASEDIRKINNVTMAIGLNQTKKEKDLNLMRVALMEIREGRGINEQVVVSQCLDLSRPCLDSHLRSQVKNLETENDYEKKRKKTE